MLTSTANATEVIRSYDDIISELAGSNNRLATATPTQSTGIGLEDVRLHASVGAIASSTQLNGRGELPKSQAMSGAELVLGIDLFSREWLAEGAIRSFQTQDILDTSISLREFDLRIVREFKMSRSNHLRFGSGISTRYISFGQAPTDDIGAEYTTPALVALLGYKFNLIESVNLTADITYRPSLISDSIDDGALDGGLRIGGSF